MIRKLVPHSLMTRLISYFLLLSLVTVGPAIYTAFSRAKESLKQAAFDRLVAVAVLKENELKRWMNQQHQNMAILAGLPELELLLDKQDTSPNYQLAYRYLTHHLTLTFGNHLIEAFILDAQGKVMISTQKVHEGTHRQQEDYFIQGQQKPFIRWIHASMTTPQPSVVMAVPVRDFDGRLLAVLVAKVNTDELDEIMQQRIGLGRSGETYLIDSSHSFISANEAENLKWPHKVYSEAIDNVLRGYDGVGLYLNYQQIPVVGVYRWVAEYDMAIIAEMRQDEAFASAEQLASITFMIWTICSLLLAVGIYLLVRQFTHPIQSLVNTAKAISAGNLHQQAQAIGIREFDYLANVFNDMTTKLRQTLEHLENLVQQRTAELAKVNLQLQQDIAERQRTEHILRDSQHRLAETQRLAQLGSWELDVITKEVQWSEETFKIVGFEPQTDPPPFKEYLARIHPDDVTLLLENIDKAIHLGMSFEIELRYRHHDGSCHYTITKAQPVFNGTEVVKLIGSILDITQLKRTEEELCKLSRAVEQSANTIVITDLTGKIEFVNPAFSAITGYSEAEAIGQNPSVLKSGLTPPEVYHELWNTLRRGEVWQGEFVNKRKDGNIFWEFATISPVKDREGKTTHYLAVKENITKRKQIEESLRLAQFSLDHAADGIYWVRLDGQLVYVNDAVCQILGYSHQELLTMNLADIEPAHVNEQWQKRWETQKLSFFESYYQRKEGNIFPVEVTANHLHFNSNHYICASIRDITERKLAEEALRKSEQKLSHLFQQTPLGVIEWDFLQKVVEWNPAAERIFGFTKAEALGHSAIELIVPDISKAHVDKVWNALLTRKGGRRSTNENKTKTGQIILCEWYSTPLIDYEGKVIGVSSLVQDVTERKQAEDELQKQYIELQTKNVELEVLNERLAAAQQEKLYQLNKAYERFVPHQFLSLLDKSSILEVRLGDQVEKEMTIMFSDIRDFTGLSEKMTPQENFSFINSYLSYMEPIIVEHRGFVDKYIGDGIMALFPINADDALSSAIAMLRKLAEYNKERQQAGHQQLVKIGIGLNSGPLMLGTVGGQNRMDGTVISDTVNLASRVETLTKVYDTPLLITMQTYQKLERALRYKIRVIDSVKVKGKSEEITVYEVFDAEPLENIMLKEKTLCDFEEGFVLYHSEEYFDACTCFEKVLQVNPNDKAAQVYLSRCKEQSRHPPW